MTLRVDDDALRAAASRWRALATGLTSGATPDVSGLSSQASAMVVNEIHAGVAATGQAFAARTHITGLKTDAAALAYRSREDNAASTLDAIAKALWKQPADDKIVGDGAADQRYGVRLVDNTFKQDGPPVPPPPPAPGLGQLQQQVQDQQRQIDDIRNQMHQPSQPTFGGLAVAAGTGCGGGALVASETGPGAVPTCVITGGLAGIGYLLGKIWE